MKQQGKPCIAYGSEAGYMDSFIEKTVRKLLIKRTLSQELKNLCR